jgi:structural maintenance of chromosome 4
VQSQLEDLRKRIGELRSSRDDREEEIKKTVAKKEKMTEYSEQMNNQMKQAKLYESQLQSELQSARHKANEASSLAKTAKEQSRMLKALMKEKELGRIPGIHGRLGSLGVIDEKYDIAISTCCPQLDNIIVDTVSTAQACIKILKEQTLGRGVFIVLEKLAKFNLKRIDTPQNVPRLFDLVKSKDPKYLPAFYSVLKDTLVANNMNQANQIAYGKQRWRVVTLDGKLIDKSGTMTGGGTRVAKGAMSSKFADEGVSPEKLAKLEEDLKDKENKWDKFQSDVQDLENKIEKVSRELPNLDVVASKLKLDFDSYHAQIQTAKAQYKNLESQPKTTPEDLEKKQQLNKQIVKYSQELDQLKISSKSLESDINQLQNKILEIGGVQLRTQKSKVDDIKNEMEILQHKFTKSQVDLNKSKKDLKMATKAIEKHENEIQTIESDLELIEKELKIHSEKSVVLREDQTEIRSQIGEKSKELEELKTRLDDNREHLAKLRTIEASLQNEMEELNRIVTESKGRTEHWKSEKQRLTLQSLE